MGMHGGRLLGAGVRRAWAVLAVLALLVGLVGQPSSRVHPVLVGSSAPTSTAPSTGPDNLWVTLSGTNPPVNALEGFPTSSASGNVAPTWTTSRQELNEPEAMAVDPKTGDVWVANAAGGVDGLGSLVGLAPVTPSAGTIQAPVPDAVVAAISGPKSGVVAPSGLAFDASGDLWVVSHPNSGSGSGAANPVVEEFTPLQLAEAAAGLPDPAPAATGTLVDVPGARAIAVDPVTGSLWVANEVVSAIDAQAAQDVYGFAPSQFTASGGPVAELSSFVFPPPSGEPFPTSNAIALAFDSAGDLYVGFHVLVSSDLVELRSLPPAGQDFSGCLNSTTGDQAVECELDPSAVLGQALVQGLSIDSNGDLLVSDGYGGGSILEYAASQLTAGGSSPAAPSQTLTVPGGIDPTGLAVVGGSLWVEDDSYNTGGVGPGELATWPLATLQASGSSPSLAPTGVYGGSTSGLDNPIGVAVDPLTGDVWVANHGYDGVGSSLSALTPNSLRGGFGSSLATIVAPSPGSSGGSSTECGPSGEQEPCLGSPEMVAFDASGDLFVVDGDNTIANPNFSVTEYSAAQLAAAVKAGGVSDPAPAGFFEGSYDGFDPVGLALDSSTGLLWVSVQNDASPAASALLAFPESDLATPQTVATPSIVVTGSTSELQSSSGSGPAGLAVSGGDLWVADETSNTLLAYSLSDLTPSAGTLDPAPVAVVSGSNTGLDRPFGLAVDSAGNLWVAQGSLTSTPGVEEFALGSGGAAPNGNVAPSVILAGSNTGFDQAPPSGIAVAGEPGPEITTTSLPGGVVGQPYVAQLQAQGGTTPYTWSATGLPDGLTLDPATGTITGTPAADATSSPVVVTVTDSESPPLSATATFVLAIGIAVTTTSLPDAVVGQQYSVQLQAIGGTQPYSWKLEKGVLPDGLSLDSKTGVISGTPTASAQSGSVTFGVTDSSQPSLSASSGSLELQVKLVGTPNSSLPVAVAGLSYSASAGSVVGGTPPYSWSATGLPSGLSIDQHTGQITGTLEANDQPESAQVQVTVSDAGTQVATFTDTILVRVFQWQAVPALSQQEPPPPSSADQTVVPSTIAWDPATNQLVGYGNAQSAFPVTYVWSGGGWQVQGNAGGPIYGSTGGILVFDPKAGLSGELLLIGGEEDEYLWDQRGFEIPEFDFFTHVWAWTGSSWQQLHSSIGPGVPGGTIPYTRADATATYDPATGQVLLFGGESAVADTPDDYGADPVPANSAVTEGFVPVNSFSAFSVQGTTVDWVGLPSGGQSDPPGGPGVAMAYDPAMSNGNDGTGAVVVLDAGQTWVYTGPTDGSTPSGTLSGWADVGPAPESTCGPDGSMVAKYDPSLGMVVAIPGQTGNGCQVSLGGSVLPNPDSTFVWDGTAWQVLSADNTLPAGGSTWGTVTPLGPDSGEVGATGGLTFDPVLGGLLDDAGDVLSDGPVLQTTETATLTEGKAQDVQLQVAGGEGPYTFALASGSSLPSGLTLSSTGTLTGTPTTTSATTTTTATVTITDSQDPPVSTSSPLVVAVAPPAPSNPNTAPPPAPSDAVTSKSASGTNGSTSVTSAALAAPGAPSGATGSLTASFQGTGAVTVAALPPTPSTPPAGSLSIEGDSVDFDVKVAAGSAISQVNLTLCPAFGSGIESAAVEAGFSAIEWVPPGSTTQEPVQPPAVYDPSTGCYALTIGSGPGYSPSVSDLSGTVFGLVPPAQRVAPTLSSASPTTVSTSGGTSLTLTGSGLAAGGFAVIGGIEVPLASVDSSGTTATVVAPAHAAGSVSMEVVVDGQASNTLSLTYSAPSTSSPSPSGPPTDTATSTSPTGTAQASAGGVTATGTGEGTLTVIGGETTNPTGVALGDATGLFGDVHVSPGSTFTSVTIQVCDVGDGRSLDWFDATSGTWLPFSEQSPGPSGCLDATVTASTSPSIADLTGTPIAVVTSPPPSTGQAPSPSPTPTPVQVPTPGGHGYWLIGQDGGVFAFGSARFYGSLPGLGVSVSDIVGAIPTPDGHGYWLIGQDGGVFAFGDAPYLGSLPGLGVRVSDIVGAIPTPDGHGYWLVGKDGGVFALGDAPYLGSLPGLGIPVSDVAGGAG